jgi:hypothetical protein
MLPPLFLLDDAELKRVQFKRERHAAYELSKAIGDESTFPGPSHFRVPNFMVNMFHKNPVKNCPTATVAVGEWGRTRYQHNHLHLPTGFIPGCYYRDHARKCFYSENRNPNRVEGRDLQQWLNTVEQQQQQQTIIIPSNHDHVIEVIVQ